MQCIFQRFYYNRVLHERGSALFYQELVHIRLCSSREPYLLVEPLHLGCHDQEVMLRYLRIL